MNSVTIVGRVTKEPILKKTPVGNCCFVTVAVTVNKDVADFFNVKLNDVHAENCRKYVHKGDVVSVSGSVHLSKWGDEKQYSSLSIDRARIEFFGKRANPTGVPETDEPRVRVMDEEDVPDFVKQSNGFEEVDDEDMPFF